MNPTQPSKEAVEAAKELTYWPTSLTERISRIQQAIDTALAAQQKELEQLRAEVKGWSEANAAHAPVHLRVVTQLAALTQLVGKIPHRMFQRECHPDCLACQRDRVLGGKP